MLNVNASTVRHALDATGPRHERRVRLRGRALDLVEVQHPRDHLVELAVVEDLSDDTDSSPLDLQESRLGGSERDDRRTVGEAAAAQGGGVA